MRRGLVHVFAWILATGAAVTLSWWGVHTVMAGTAYDPPRALPLTAAEATATTASPRAPATRRTPSVSPSPSAGRPAPSGPSARPAPDASPSASERPDRAAGGPAPSSSGPVSAAPSGEVRGYDTAGGRVVFDIGTAAATLVSATPGAGWTMQVWKTPTWIRVEFTSDADPVSVFCTWHDGPPRVEVGSY